MTIDKHALSLPETVGEQTLVAIQEQVNEATKAGGRRSQQGLFTRRELRKGETLYRINEVPDAIYMLRGGTIRLVKVDDRQVGAMPITRTFEAVPNKTANNPILGARYFFTRSRVTLAYRAETPCSVYGITSASLKTMYETNTENLQLIMYWLIACSDISDVFIPIANKALGQPVPPIESTQELYRAVEEFRASRSHPGMPELLGKLYDRFSEQRRKRASELGIEPSVA